MKTGFQPPRLLSIMDLYLGSQLFAVVGFAMVLFSVIWLAPETLFKLMQYLFAGKITLLQAAEMFLYHLPEVLQQTIPVAVLVGGVFLFQRLTQSYELIACLASGISPTRLMMPVLGVGLLYGGLHFFSQEVLTPVTANRLERMMEQADLKEIENRNFLFVEKNHHGQLKQFFMIGQTQKQPWLRDLIMLYYVDTPDHGARISRILHARAGRCVLPVQLQRRGAEYPEGLPCASARGQWELLNGVEYFADEDGVSKKPVPFLRQQVRTNPYASRLLDYSRLNPLAMSFGDLQKFIKLLKEGGQLQNVPEYEVRLWQKFAGPLATVLFALFGALLGMERVRTNRTYGLTFGALIIFVYSILVPFSSNIGGLDLVAPWLVAIIPLSAATALTALIIALRPKSG